jgi:cytochrome c553
MTIILPAASAAGNRSSITAAVRRNARVLTPFAALVISACMGNGQSAVRRNASVQEAQVTAALTDGTVQVCSLCHGFGGRSISPTVPHLAGQRAEYIEAQLEAFRDHERADPDASAYMWGMAEPLSDRVIHGLASYYAAQAPATGTPADPIVIAAGRKIYEQGVADKVLPCVACHGAKAEGAGTTPRLAGQHRLSLERQLAYFATSTRTNEVMHQEAMNLTDQQIQALSAYLAAQSEGKPIAVAAKGSVTQAQVDDAALVCSSCHGFDGGNLSPTFTFPRLAGQQKGYLIAQLKAFRDKKRDDDRARTYMWDVAESLDDTMIEQLAAHYAAQESLPGTAQDPTDMAAGRKIYEQGIADRVLPCIACHGAKAEGAGPTPRLVGQHRLSLERQLTYFAASTRTNDVMHQEAMNLTDQQIQALSAYLAAQSEGKPIAVAAKGSVSQAQVDDAALVCSSCHGFDGESLSPTFTFPRLAGQQKGYLIAQLKAFRDKKRDDDRARTYMWDVAESLDDTMIERLAAHYAAQESLPGTAQDPTDTAAGRKIYEQGIADRVLPCIACHGAKAEGAGTTPRLAGQHRLSLERQLTYFAASTRTNDVMHQEAMNLTDQQIQALSAYLAARSEGKPIAVAAKGSVTREQVEGAALVCSSCHGFDGGNLSPTFTFPRLAGQQKGYLIAQLKAFRDKKRDDDRARTYMWDVAESLDDTMIERLAAHYAAQNSSDTAQDPTEMVAGRKIYEQGIAEEIPPCLTCHGAKARGAGTTPRLAGQHRLSLERQLTYFAANARTGGVMHQEAMKLTDRQIQELSAYLAAQ